MIRLSSFYRAAAPLVLLMSAGSGLAAQGVVEPHTPLSTVINALNTLRSNYQDAFNDGNASAVAAMYTSDAIAITPQGKVLMGRDAIRENVAGQAKAGAQVTITTDSVRVMGNTAVDVGKVMMGGKTYHYLVVLRHGPSGWKLFRAADVAEADSTSGM